MPIVKLKSIFCCNSEDKNHPAVNLLSEANKKWICEENGLKSAYVTLQLERPTQITGIDIGNENSAFIEAFVGKNSWPDDKFRNILLASSFMTPLEGRSSENKNRVRCFGKNDLMPDVRDEKWDLVKLVCTQPFSKYVQYGLSLVKIYTNEPMPVEPTHTLTETKTDSPKAKVNCQEVLKLPENNVFSQFRFRQDSSDSDKEIETSSSLFSKWKQMKKDDFSHNKGLSSAATIRRASASETELKNCSTFNKTIESSKPSAKHKNNQTNNDKTPDRTKGENRNRDSLMYDDEDVNTSNPRLEQVISKDKERIAREKEEYASKKKDAGNKKPSGREEKSRKKMEASSSRYNIFLDMDAKAGSDSSQNKDKCEKDMADEDKAVDDTANKNKPDKDIQSMLMTSPDSSQSTTSPSKNIATPKVVKKRRSSSLDRSEETPNKRNKPLPSPAPSPVTAATFSPAPSQSSSEVASTPPSSSPPNKQQIPFHKLLAGVTFVISGIQNPDRATIRDEGISMGAKYRPDWDDRCTHLICAFANTPKYRQVQGKGIIVNRNWLSECYTKKKKLPWQDFKL